MNCYRESYMSIHFKRIYAQILDKREVKRKEELEEANHLPSQLCTSFNSKQKINKCIMKNLFS